MRSTLAEITLTRFVGFLQICFEACLRHRVVVMLLTALAIAGSVASFGKLKVQLNLYETVDPSFPATVNDQKMREDFRDREVLTLIFKNSKSAALSPAQLNSLENWIYTERKHNADLESVYSPFDIRFPHLDEKEHRLWYPRAYDENQKRETSFDFLRNSPWAGVATDTNFQDLAVDFTLRDREVPGVFGRFSPESVASLMEQIKPLLQKSGLEVFSIGSGSLMYHLHRMFVQDSFGNPLILLIFLIFLRLFIGTLTSGLLFVFSLVLTEILVYAGMAWTHTPIDLLTNNVFLLVCIAGMEDFLFVFFWASRKQEGLRSAFRHMLAPAFFTSLTTVCGFGSLCFCSIRMIRNFGAWTAIGTLIEWAVTFLILPSVLEIFFRKKADFWVRPEKAIGSKWVKKLEGFSLGKIAIFLSVLMMAVGAFEFSKINFDYNPAKDFPENHPASAAYRYLEQSRGWRGTVDLVFPRNASSVQIQEAYQQVRLDPNVKQIETPQAVDEFYTKNFEAGIQSLVLRDIQSAEFYKKYKSADGQTRALVYLKNISVNSIAATYENLQKACANVHCVPTGEILVLLEYSQQVSKVLFGSFAISLVLVALILMFLARAMRVGSPWKLIFSVLWCPIVMMGIVGISGIKVGLLNAVFAAVIVGLTGDNAIQFLFSQKDQNLLSGVDRLEGAALQLFVMLSCASLVFVAFTLVPLKILGILLCVGFVVAWVGDVVLLRGLLK